MAAVIHECPSFTNFFPFFHFIYREIDTDLVLSYLDRPSTWNLYILYVKSLNQRTTTMTCFSHSHSTFTLHRVFYCVARTWVMIGYKRDLLLLGQFLWMSLCRTRCKLRLPRDALIKGLLNFIIVYLWPTLENIDHRKRTPPWNCMWRVSQSHGTQLVYLWPTMKIKKNKKQGIWPCLIVAHGDLNSVSLAHLENVPNEEDFTMLDYHSQGPKYIFGPLWNSTKDRGLQNVCHSQGLK